MENRVYGESRIWRIAYRESIIVPGVVPLSVPMLDDQQIECR